MMNNDKGRHELVTHDLLTRRSTYNRRLHIVDYLHNLSGRKTPLIPRVVFQIVRYDYEQYRRFSDPPIRRPNHKLLHRILKDRHWGMYTEYMTQFTHYLVLSSSGAVVDTAAATADGGGSMSTLFSPTQLQQLDRRFQCVLRAVRSLGIGTGRRNLFYISYILNRLVGSYLGGDDNSNDLNACATLLFPLPKTESIRREFEHWWNDIVCQCRHLFPDMKW